MSSPGDIPLTGGPKNGEDGPAPLPDAEKPEGELTSSLSKKRKREVHFGTAAGDEAEKGDEKSEKSLEGEEYKSEVEGDDGPGPDKRVKVIVFMNCAGLELITFVG